MKNVVGVMSLVVCVLILWESNTAPTSTNYVLADGVYEATPMPVIVVPSMDTTPAIQMIDPQTISPGACGPNGCSLSDRPTVINKAANRIGERRLFQGRVRGFIRRLFSRLRG